MYWKDEEDRVKIECEKQKAAREKKKHPHLKEAKIIAYLDEPVIQRRDFIGVVYKNNTNLGNINVDKKKKEEEPEEYYVIRNGIFVKVSDLKKDK
ncbi:MAG: hypothetical protein LBT51_04375 [Fusobacteriaceae bacterium]|jgi:hypothetical protein|nr:hypothetical protein [Fusobacteriaceae bacterium]